MSEMERQVRERAYLLWEQAGQPDGRSEEFWLTAWQELVAAPLEEPPELAFQHGVPTGMPGERIAEQGVLDDVLGKLVTTAPAVSRND